MDFCTASERRQRKAKIWNFYSRQKLVPIQRQRFEQPEIANRFAIRQRSTLKSFEFFGVDGNYPVREPLESFLERKKIGIFAGH